ncbi:MAG TPA: DUF3127 domain-containing protein [Bacteroidales bacterium]|nr:DUF3127 domain-containing protein [Bacteroidales bacterium]
MSFEITGKVVDVSPVQQMSDKFRKREFVIESSEQGSDGREFADYIKFQCIQDRADLINESFLNEMVKVTFNIKGNRWERDGKVAYFTNLDAWKIEKAGADSDQSDDFGPPPLLDDLPPDNEEFEDLPF